MRKFGKTVFLTGVLALLLCAAAFAAEPASAGVKDVTASEGYTLTPLTADGSTIAEVDGFYAVAVRFTLTGPATAEMQYLVFALSSADVPKQENIVYIDQLKASDTSITFPIYPSDMVSGQTYYIYVVGTDRLYTQVASFVYYMPYTLGDVDADGYWTANDALFTLQIAVNKSTLKINGDDVAVTETMRTAADVDKDTYVSANDALLILQKAVGKDVF